MLTNVYISTSRHKIKKKHYRTYNLTGFFYNDNFLKS